MNRIFLTLTLSLFVVCGLFGQEEPARGRVLVGTVANRRPEILRELFWAFDGLHRNGCAIDFYIVDGTTAPASKEVVQQFIGAHPGRALVEVKPSQGLNTTTGWELSKCKNKMLQYARDKGYDYFFLVDSDVIVHPKTIEQLMNTGNDIVATIVWTTVKEEQVPQVWMCDGGLPYETTWNEKLSAEAKESRRRDFYSQLHVPGTYEVAGVRSCMLMSKKALQEKSIGFSHISNLSFAGEDAHFCMRAEAVGFPLYVDTHYPAYRIIRETGESSLAGLEKVKKEWAAESTAVG